MYTSYPSVTMISTSCSMVWSGWRPGWCSQMTAPTRPDASPCLNVWRMERSVSLESSSTSVMDGCNSRTRSVNSASRVVSVLPGRASGAEGSFVNATNSLMYMSGMARTVDSISAKRSAPTYTNTRQLVRSCATLICSNQCSSWPSTETMMHRPFWPIFRCGTLPLVSCIKRTAALQKAWLSLRNSHPWSMKKVFWASLI
mmetsp:Transcript_24842/g.47027  ORF Transcript_24842/g.47027 Transcript_24842/m.47027 type:complete len:200 (+) Transcript_24842:1259-1858(+)